ncbi:Retrovirus-related Pol polyprotein from transposon RE1 [Senna tora]|uniref:Retrovirus-related Pol polyprotein from transposon RE1 n=1 Tax=Senna tora TaxID=362788 RepID=A0A835C4G3_9FABA|nr:Retrovirus-related Pol polyprotein from transposon RE1 [Senna tora]
MKGRRAGWSPANKDEVLEILKGGRLFVRVAVNGNGGCVGQIERVSVAELLSSCHSVRHDLLSIVEGKKIPLQFLTPDDAKSGTENPDFTLWRKQDKLLLCLNLCKLDYMKKGTRTMTEHFLRIKALVDSLAAIGNPIAESDQIHVILNGLGHDYDAFVTSINTRREDYSVSEIESLLLAQEIIVDNNSKSTSPTETLSVNVATTDSKDKSSNSGQSQQNNFNSNHRGMGRNGTGL